MATRQTQKATTDFSAESAPETGRYKDTETRSVQRMGNSEECLGTNLSTKGAMILGVTSDDEVDLVIFENGIWIPTKNE